MKTTPLTLFSVVLVLFGVLSGSPYITHGRGTVATDSTKPIAALPEQTPKPSASPGRLAYLNEELNLTQRQRNQIRMVLSLIGSQVSSLKLNLSLSREERTSTTRQLWDRANEQIASLLTSDQLEKFSELNERGNGHWQTLVSNFSRSRSTY